MLTLLGIHKSYRTKKGVKNHVLKGVDAEFGQKGFVFILGKSGSGKSTLLNILGGLDRYDKGDIIIKETSSSSFTANYWDSYRNTYIGFVFQEFNILDNYSVEKNVSLALEVQGYKKEEIKNRVDTILKQVGLEELKKRKPNELSGGQKQRVAIARALVKNPDIILADEPTGNLDSTTGEQILQIFRKLAEEKLVIIVSHDKEAAHTYADRIITMGDGQITSDQYNEGGLKYISNNIEKYRTNGELTHVIRLPKGKSFDDNAKQLVNDVLKENQASLYIPLPKNTKIDSEDTMVINSLIKKYNTDIHLPIVKDIANIQGSKNADLKNRKNPAKVSLGIITKPFKLIKSKLPLYNSFQLAMYSIWRKKIRLLFTLLLFFVALGLFGFSETIARFDYSQAIARSYELGQIQQVPLNNVKQADSWGGNESKYTTTFDSESIDEQMLNYPDIKYAKSYDLATSPYEISKSAKLVEPTVINGFISVKNPNDLDIKVVAGKFPSSKNQVLITDFVADYLIANNKKYNGYNSLIGTSYRLDGISYSVVGVAGTDYDQYTYLNNISPAEKEEMTSEISLYQSRHDSLYSRFIVNDSFTRNVNVFKGIFIAGTTLPDSEYEEEIYHISDSFTLYTKDIFNRSDKNDFLYTKKGFNGNLKEDEVILSLEGLHAFTEDDNMQPVHEILEQAQMNGNNDKIYDSLVNTGILPTEPIELFIVSDEEWVRIEKQTVNIVGIIDTYQYNQAFESMGIHNAIFLPQSSYQRISPFVSGKVQQVVTSLSDSASYNEAFFRDVHSMGWRHDTVSGETLGSIDDFVSSAGIVFRYISVGFALFVTLFMFMNISQSVLASKHEIGTLRAIGAKGRDVSKIFIIEALILSTITFVLAVIALFVVTSLANNGISNQIGVPLTIFNPSLIIIVELAILASIVAIAASFIPAKRVSMMKPIDAILDK